MKKRKVITIVLLILFFAGLSVLLYPSISSYWNSIAESRAVVDYDTIIESLTPKDYSQYFDEAQEYNESLAQLNFPLTDYDQADGYEDCHRGVAIYEEGPKEAFTS